MSSLRTIVIYVIIKTIEFNLISEGNEMVPDVIETPPKYPLELTYRTVRTFPGMRVTAETTKFKPMVEW